MPGTLLEDFVGFMEAKLEESSGKATTFECVFQRSDVRNQNGRVYPKALWQKVLSNESAVMENVRGRGMVGMMGHPRDGVTDERNGAFVVTKLDLREDGTVWGRGEVLETSDGKTLAEYLHKHVRIGISSRGVGTIGADGMVQEDYQLRTFDAVFNPSTPGAFPQYPAQRRVDSASTTEDTTPNVAAPTASTDKPGVRHEPVPVTEASMSLDKITLIETRVTPALQLRREDARGYTLDRAHADLEEALRELMPLAREPESRCVAESVIARVSRKRTELAEWASSPTALVASGATGVMSAAPAVTEAEKKLAEATSQLAEAKKGLDEAKAKLATVEEVSKKLFETNKGLQAKVTETGAENNSLAEKLAAAMELIRAMREHQLGDAVGMAVESVLRDHPNLVPLKETLLACESVDAVRQTCEKILAVAKPVTAKATSDVALPPAGTKQGSAPVVEVAAKGETKDVPPAKMPAVLDEDRSMEIGIRLLEGLNMIKTAPAAATQA